MDVFEFVNSLSPEEKPSQPSTISTPTKEEDDDVFSFVNSINNQSQSGSQSFQSEDRSLTGEFAKGIGSGWEGLKKGYYGMGALAGHALDKISEPEATPTDIATGQQPMGDLKRWGIEGMKQADEESKQYQGAVPSIKNVWESEDKLRDVPLYLSYQFGNILPSIAEAAAVTLATGGVGTVAGGVARGGIKAFLENSAVKSITKDLVSKGLTKEAAEEQAVKLGADLIANKGAQALAREGGRNIGAMAGPAIATYPMETGGMIADQVSEKGDIQNATSAALLGIPATAIEYLGGNMRLLNLFKNPESKQAIKELAKEGEKDIFKKLGNELVWQPGGEAMQEATQAFIERMDKALNNPNVNMFDKEALIDYADNAIGGALGGVGTGAVTAMLNKGEENKPKTPPPAATPNDTIDRMAEGFDKTVNSDTVKEAINNRNKYGLQADDAFLMSLAEKTGIDPLEVQAIYDEIMNPKPVEEKPPVDSLPTVEGATPIEAHGWRPENALDRPPEPPTPAPISPALQQFAERMAGAAEASERQSFDPTSEANRAEAANIVSSNLSALSQILDPATFEQVRQQAEEARKQSRRPVDELPAIDTAQPISVQQGTPENADTELARLGLTRPKNTNALPGLNEALDKLYAPDGEQQSQPMEQTEATATTQPLEPVGQPAGMFIPDVEALTQGKQQRDAEAARAAEADAPKAAIQAKIADIDNQLDVFNRNLTPENERTLGPRIYQLQTQKRMLEKQIADMELGFRIVKPKGTYKRKALKEGTKPPHLFTLDEWIKEAPGQESIHEAYVRNAVEKNDAVPLRVLQDYAGNDWADNAIDQLKEAQKKLPDYEQRRQRALKARKNINLDKDRPAVIVAKYGSVKPSSLRDKSIIDYINHPGNKTWAGDVLNEEDGIEIDLMSEALAQDHLIPTDKDGKWDINDVEKYVKDAILGSKNQNKEYNDLVANEEELRRGLSDEAEKEGIDPQDVEDGEIIDGQLTRDSQVKECLAEIKKLEGYLGEKGRSGKHRKQIKSAIAELKQALSDLGYKHPEGPLPKFSTVTEPTGKTQAASLQRYFDRKKRGTPVKVVQQQSELSEQILSQADKGSKIEAVYYDGTIYVVADNVSRSRGILLAATHEAVHAGIDKVLGDRYSDTMQQIREVLGLGEISDIDTEEHIGELSEKKGKARLIWGRIVRAFKNFLRSLGVQQELSRAEIDGIIGQAIAESGKVSKDTKQGIGEFAVNAMYSLKQAAKKITDNPNFVKWFGDSKVVDENGEPLVVYHGTEDDFNVFDMKHFGKTDQGESGEGFYFAHHKNDAEWYAKEKGKVMPVYLSIKNPYRNTFIGFGHTLDTDELKAQGYDGVITKDKDGYIIEYVAFSPTQIKSIYNTGSFDAGNPDIRFSLKESPAPTDKQAVDTTKLLMNKAPTEVFSRVQASISSGRDINPKFIIQIAREVVEDFNDTGTELGEGIISDDPKIRSESKKSDEGRSTVY